MSVKEVGVVVDYMACRVTITEQGSEEEMQREGVCATEQAGMGIQLEREEVGAEHSDRSDYSNNKTGNSSGGTDSAGVVGRSSEGEMGSVGHVSMLQDIQQGRCLKYQQGY